MKCITLSTELICTLTDHYYLLKGLLPCLLSVYSKPKYDLYPVYSKSRYMYIEFHIV